MTLHEGKEVAMRRISIVNTILILDPVYLLKSSFFLKSEFQKSEFWENKLFSDVW
jgi:hypothetical protein